MKTLFFIFLFLFMGECLFSQTITDIERNVFYMKEGLDVFEKVEKEKTENWHKYVYYNKSEPLIIRFEEKQKVKKTVDWYYFEQILICTETTWQDTTSGKILYTEKTYHHNGALIAWLNSENSFVDATTPAYKRLEKKLDTTAIQLRNEVLFH